MPFVTSTDALHGAASVRVNHPAQYRRLPAVSETRIASLRFLRFIQTDLNSTPMWNLKAVRL
jgi:hypothetical protein